MSSVNINVASPAPNGTDDDPVKNKAVNGEDELFWRKVREAYRMVSANSSLDLEIEIGLRHAHINIRQDKSKNPPLEYVAVHIWDIEHKPPVLVVP